MVQNQGLSSGLRGGGDTSCVQGLGWEKRDCTLPCARRQGGRVLLDGAGLKLHPPPHGESRQMTHQAQQWIGTGVNSGTQALPKGLPNQI